MEGQLLTYALVKALYDRNRDYIDTFTPFILGVLDTTTAMESDDAARAASETRSIAMPIHVVERVLRKAEHAGLVETLRIHKGSVGFRLTPKGESLCCSKEDEEHVSRRVNALLLAVCEYARDVHAQDLTSERAKRELLSLISENLEAFARYVNPRASSDRSPVPDGDGIVVLRYIEHAKDSVPEHYATIRDMVFGSIITAVLQTPDATSLNELERPLKGTIAYLDSNVIFALMGMQSSHLTYAAQELAELMKGEGFSLRTFDFVLDEARNVLRRYARSSGTLPGGHNPESVYVQLRLRGVRQSDALELAASLEDSLRESGVRVESVSNFGIASYTPKHPELFDDLVRAKAAGRPDADFDAITGAAKVDMAAIEQIASRRGARVTKLEEARYVFLTRDRRLATFNRDTMGHQASGTVPEVLLDVVLTNLLWLKNPRLSVSLESIIAAHSDDLLKYDALWLRFSEIAAKLRAENRIDAADTSALLTEESMIRIMEQTPTLTLDEVDEELVLQEAHRFRAEIDERVAALEELARVSELEAQNAAHERDLLAETVSAQGQDAASALESKDASIRHFIGQRARTKGLWYGIGCVLPVVLAAWGISAWLLSRWDAGPLRWIVGCIVLLLSSGFAWAVMQHLSEQHREQMEMKMLREHGLT